ncbi:hypothetical protein J8281_18225 [Aquimarina sp. U1-2]|uniref:hypothetical protein n=1 Tax=Aquimarina sp. U1-2 TaxID=2823141 RepID=UPI001AECF4CB|nr:hypothetical protein [Aquimarina sp. U1-2]MBP2834140.1 hypothetical protein [Aquimarina sp. U1-2]
MKKNCIENSFSDPKSYSRYTSSSGRSTRIDGFKKNKYTTGILDFFCHELMLGIEVDGYSHE